MMVTYHGWMWGRDGLQARLWLLSIVLVIDDNCLIDLNVNISCDLASFITWDQVFTFLNTSICKCPCSTSYIDRVDEDSWKRLCSWDQQLD